MFDVASFSDFVRFHWEPGEQKKNKKRQKTEQMKTN